MENDEKIYLRLQKHLDSLAVGYPATSSGAEIRILKHIFTPDEARLTICLTYKLEPIETIYHRARGLVDSLKKLSMIFDRLEEKGGLESKIKGDIKYYCAAPLIVGMYEYQLDRLTPEFIKDFDTYTSDRKFGVSFLSTELPQMRTIPIGKNIAIFECICRKKQSLLDEPCKLTERKETCLGIGDFAKAVLRSGVGRTVAGY